MEHDANEIWDKVTGYLAGEATPAEAADVERWIAASEDNRIVFERVQATWNGVIAPAVPKMDLRAMEAGVAALISSQSFSRPKAVSHQRTRYAYMAASILILIAVPSLFKHFNPDSVADFKEYRTGVGQQAVVQLADGSKAVLAPLTTLRFQADKGSRSAIVNGQVLFTVTKSEGAPFVVRAGGVSTRVLGTTFDVRRYGDDSVTRIIVAEGKVVSGDAVLSTGDVAVVSSNGNVGVQHGQNVSQAVAWSQGVLSFKDAPLSEVLKECERWYGFEFRVESKELAEQPVTAVIARESVSAVIDKLAIILDARATRKGNTVTFTWGTR